MNEFAEHNDFKTILVWSRIRIQMFSFKRPLCLCSCEVRGQGLLLVKTDPPLGPNGSLNLTVGIVILQLSCADGIRIMFASNQTDGVCVSHV